MTNAQQKLLRPFFQLFQDLNKILRQILYIFYIHLYSSSESSVVIFWPYNPNVPLGLFGTRRANDHSVDCYYNQIEQKNKKLVIGSLEKCFKISRDRVRNLLPLSDNRDIFMTPSLRDATFFLFNACLLLAIQNKFKLVYM